MSFKKFRNSSAKLIDKNPKFSLLDRQPLVVLKLTLAFVAIIIGK